MKIQELKSYARKLCRYLRMTSDNEEFKWLSTGSTFADSEGTLLSVAKPSNNSINEHSLLVCEDLYCRAK